MSKADELYSLLEPKVTELGYKCKEITFDKIGQDWILTVYIDNDNHDISIDDCEIVSRTLSPYLDETDPIEPSYILEVSSPGIDRPLKTNEDFNDAIGTMIEVKLYKKFNGKKEFIGELLENTDDTFTIAVDKDEITFNKKEVSKVAPAIIF